MEIVDCCFGSPELERFVHDYNVSVKNRELAPYSINVAFYLKEFEQDRRGRIIFGRNGGRIAGFLQYRMNAPIGDGVYDGLVGNDLEEMGLWMYPPENVACITSMESFPQKAGTGRRLMDVLKSRPDVKAIFATASGYSIGFYNKMGFDRVYQEPGKRNPLMVWKLD